MTLYNVLALDVGADATALHRYTRCLFLGDVHGNLYFVAYSPDLQGCVATGETREDAERNMHEAIQMCVQGLVEDGYLFLETEFDWNELSF